MEIRDVVDSDWAAVWGFLQQIVAAGDTYCWPPDTSEDAARMWWLGKPGGRVLVAVDDGAVVGTAELHPNQPAAGSHVANAGFMVSPTVAGRGVGRALAQRVLVRAGRSAEVRSDPALARPVDVPVQVGSNAKLRQATGWAPTRTLDDIIDDLIHAATH